MWEGVGVVVVGARHSTNQKMSQKMSDQEGKADMLVRNEIRKHHNASGGG